MHISSKHVHGVHRPDTLLHRDETFGNGWIADSNLEMDAPYEIEIDIFNIIQNFSIEKNSLVFQ